MSFERFVSFIAFVVAFIWINLAAEECPELTKNFRSGWFYFLWGVPALLIAGGAGYGWWGWFVWLR